MGNRPSAICSEFDNVILFSDHRGDEPINHGFPTEACSLIMPIHGGISCDEILKLLDYTVAGGKKSHMIGLR